jgi:hypothetical protein
LGGKSSSAGLRRHIGLFEIAGMSTETSIGACPKNANRQSAEQRVPTINDFGL